MKYFEFGQENPELMVLLPGGGVCYRGAIPIAEEMAKVYHVVLVAYDGFNPDEPGTEYKSRIAEYLPLFPDRAFLLAYRQGRANTQKDRVQNDGTHGGIP